ncbi:organic hydroperoxide resistance protein [Methylobacterium sp. WL30]|jgi:Ohr subfamily peroxiredoxin|uniref:organic hydroperoxide resistance protein n=1 Tax=unclassified Methylobacterium TaxID=2615210 RepID=UPI0011C90C3C|nr:MULTISPECIES: organic hydroperoxide resistance protein [unclassified Methylobacterium]RZK83973.1 MAG: organic hydroperoxide resistance protein [Methylobacterium sp.]MCJ2005965.1 organic hydroperoxide resistance protein [Methylobacterium sp. J-092]MCJ2038958.1 organic hydroperoxide resistance protein [Methylobacterium sp. J-059]MCJ2074179.1 organic hydroperoxide resistance protein [Methylobacterium sp. E-016]MCJ2114254.1 organic hydroperoxide resistance protein [Methylobacterium sp. E-025]
MQALYTAHAHATGGREGSAATDDSRLGVGLSTPKELGGNGGPGSNPEQLFAAGYAACFLGAIKFVAAQDKVKVPEDARVDAEVGIGKRDDGTGFGLTVSLKASLPGIDAEKAADLVKRADVVCPYSHATRGNIRVDVAAV